MRHHRNVSDVWVQNHENRHVFGVQSKYAANWMMPTFWQIKSVVHQTFHLPLLSPETTQLM